jgi:hypothetical protein
MLGIKRVGNRRSWAILAQSFPPDNARAAQKAKMRTHPIAQVRSYNQQELSGG